MTKKDYARGVLAGFLFFALWYLNVAWVVSGLWLWKDGGVFWIFYLFLIPFLSALISIFLVHHKNYKYIWAKFGIFFVSATGFTLLLYFLLPSFGEVWAFFNRDDYTILCDSAFPTGIMTFFYFLIFAISFFVYFLTRTIIHFIKRRKHTGG